MSGNTGIPSQTLFGLAESVFSGPVRGLIAHQGNSAGPGLKTALGFLSRLLAIINMSCIDRAAPSNRWRWPWGKQSLTCLSFNTRDFDIL